ncbi:SemiSWEET transporter [uncultured Amphritea sp.]|uniref:SemiSWEET family sugar transporter n=1 Tax=uncultured Amphritea sp. TaxID=981605 RepID=UPI0026302DAE|nr:SemiSWEET transporter [uncultured Amphritea sp.]
MTTLVSLIGISAACMTTISFVPQVYAILKSKNTSGISVTMYSIFTFGVFLWVIYGFIIEDMPVFLANLITLILTLSVLTLTITSRIRQKSSQPDTVRSSDQN